MTLTKLIAVLVLVCGLEGCGGSAEVPSPEPKPIGAGQQWDPCEPERGCFARSGLECLDGVCTFECSDALKLDQCNSIGGTCKVLGRIQNDVCQRE